MAAPRDDAGEAAADARAEFAPPDIEPRAAAWLERYARAEDLQPEAVDEIELSKAEELKGKVLKALELDSVPMDWKAKFFTRVSLVSFLRGRNGDLEAAVPMMADAIKWFDSFGWWENVIRKYEEQDEPKQRMLCRKYSPNGPFGVDKRGAPVLYFRTGLMDTGGMIREVGQEVFFRSMCWGLERDQELHAEASRKAGQALIGHVTVMDCAGGTWARSGSTSMFLTWFTDNILKDHFPESAKVIFIVNTPWFFNVGWKMLAPFVPAATKAKMKIMGGSYMDTLLQHIDIEQIPEFLGGKSKEPWPYGEGGDVPNSQGGEAKGVMKDLKVSKKEAVEVEIPAGETCIYEYKIAAHDIGVTVTVDGTEEIVAPGKINAEAGLQSGQYTAPKDRAAKLSILFDNSHSWMRAKDVRYSFTVEKFPEGAFAEGGVADAETGA